MLLNTLSTEPQFDELMTRINEGTLDKKTRVKIYTKILAKSAVQGAVVGFAVLGVTAVIAAALSENIDGVTES